MLVILPAIALAVLVLYRKKTFENEIFSGSISPINNIFRNQSCKNDENEDENENINMNNIYTKNKNKNDDINTRNEKEYENENEINNNLNEDKNKNEKSKFMKYFSIDEKTLKMKIFEPIQNSYKNSLRNFISVTKVFYEKSQTNDEDEVVQEYKKKYNNGNENEYENENEINNNLNEDKNKNQKSKFMKYFSIDEKTLKMKIFEPIQNSYKNSLRNFISVTKVFYEKSQTNDEDEVVQEYKKKYNNGNENEIDDVEHQIFEENEHENDKENENENERDIWDRKISFSKKILKGDVDEDSCTLYVDTNTNYNNENNLNVIEDYRINENNEETENQNRITDAALLLRI